MNDNTDRESPQAPHPSGRHTAVAISRVTGAAAYEQRERARTSHACEPCRERKTKCDGERPSCRRCLHTGTPCHYGYGKGWRKRKTAEDLSATSRRLERYEDLLADILPMVNPQVRAMIEEARDSEGGSASSPLSDSNDQHERQSSGSQPSDRSRLPPLPLPGPSPLMAPSGRGPSGVAFDLSTSSSSSASNVRRSLARTSDDANSTARLPSIRPDGMLIESTGRSGNRFFVAQLSDSANVSNVRPDQMEESPEGDT